jgi:REP element-mobilizing transposase RayT
MRAWNDWYHVNGNTHGTWLPGDPRGWRARHHKVHVDGDYRNPPPAGQDAGLHEHTERAMVSPTVHLTPTARRAACDEMVHSLQRHGVEIVAISVDDHHFHILARFTNEHADETRIEDFIRKLVGIAKKDSARALSEAGLVKPGGVWATRFRFLSISSREHQVRVAEYIADHAKRGAAIWVCWGNKTNPSR